MKTFVELRNKEKIPFMQLYYEMLSRFQLPDNLPSPTTINKVWYFRFD